MRSSNLGFWIVALLGATACGSEDAGTASAPPGAAFGTRGSRIYELREALAGEGAPIASNNYFCLPCRTDAEAARAFDAHEFPASFARSVHRTLEAARARLMAPQNSRGAPQTHDFVPSIAGAELSLGAQPQFGEIIERGVIVTMESTRRLEWDAGDELIELTDGNQTYVMFAQVREPDVVPPDAIDLPTGWSRSIRTLQEPFVLPESPRVVVFLGLPHQHLFQRVEPPPSTP